LAHLRRSCHIAPTPPSTTHASDLDLPVATVGLRPAVRFALAATLTLAYVAFAFIVSQPWRHDLRVELSVLASWVIPLMLAYVPSLVIGFLCFTLILTHYRPPEIDRAPAGPWPAASWPSVTIVVAAWNEEETIAGTLARLGELRYDGDLSVILADNNSSDRTAERADEVAARLGLDYRRIFEPAQGKWRALNSALAEVETPIVVTLDADTYLHREALRYIVARVASRPQDQHVSACAGALIPENPTSNFLTRMQTWDYRLGINGVKAMQAAYNSTLVAEGAFSAYWCEDVRAVGGWPDAIGEDIVLTWGILARRSLVLYEPIALGFTTVPEKLARFTSQRSRWARGMFEGISVHPPRTQPRFLAKAVASIDYLVPLLDIGFLFFWVPGLILFLLGYPLIFGWWTLLVLPVTFLIYACMRVWQTHHVFRRLELRPERDTRGFLGYALIYQAITSAAALRGYWRQIRRAGRAWR
jgi:poly-beta-1,6-N-acetyl-D-glucosamine synthase